MSKGKIDVVFNITNYGVDPKITMRAMLKKANSNLTKGSLAGTLVLKPKHEIAKFETLQLILLNHNMLDELDEAISQSRGSIKVTLPNLDARFIHAKRKDEDSEYDAVLVNFGREDEPHIRIFYLSNMQSQLLKKGFNPKYTFDVEDNYLEEDDEEEQNE